MDELTSAHGFVDWLLGQRRCWIEDGYGTDLTDRIARDGLRSLYPPGLHQRPEVSEWVPDWYDPVPSLGPRMVVQYAGNALAAVGPAAVAWRIEWPDGGRRDEFAGLVERLLTAVGADRVTALVVGVCEPWPDDAAAPLEELAAVVSVLVDAAPRLTCRTGLALLDITTFGTNHPDPAAWRTPIDAAALMRAFPRLEVLHVRGALRLAAIRHDCPRRLWVYSADLCQDAARALARCEFTAMESRFVRLGG